MKIIVDENVPYAQQLFSQLGEVERVAGRAITAQQVRGADALIVRSVTPVNSELLQGSAVHFVGTATAGVDHVDQSWLRQQGIAFAAASGSNAISVVEYVLSALFCLADKQGFVLRDKRVGIIGVGHIGSLLHQRLTALGVETLLCDPPLADQGESGSLLSARFVPMAKVIAEADIITLHTPDIQSGPYCTRHLINADVLAAMKDQSILINSSRGSVVDNRALLAELGKGRLAATVLDVWEGEPDLSLPLLEKVSLASAHIAGYALESKVRGSLWIYQALSKFLASSVSQPQITLETLLPPPAFNRIRLQRPLDQRLLTRLTHLVYDIRRDDMLLRSLLGQQKSFDDVRKHYPERREFASLQVQCRDVKSAELLGNIGFSTGVC